jgi:hypothetical protein
VPDDFCHSVYFVARPITWNQSIKLDAFVDRSDDRTGPRGQRVHIIQVEPSFREERAVQNSLRAFRIVLETRIWYAFTSFNDKMQPGNPPEPIVRITSSIFTKSFFAKAESSAG